MQYLHKYYSTVGGFVIGQKKTQQAETVLWFIQILQMCMNLWLTFGGVNWINQKS